MSKFTNQRLRRTLPSTAYNEQVDEEINWAEQTRRTVSGEIASIAEVMLNLTNNHEAWADPADPYTQAVRKEIKGVLNEFQGRRRVEGE